MDRRMNILRTIEVLSKIKGAQESLGALTFNQMTDLTLDNCSWVIDVEHARASVAAAIAHGPDAILEAR
jgi:hypothetical protein